MVAALLAIALAGCSGGSSHSSSSPATKTPSGSTSGATTGSTSASIAPTTTSTSVIVPAYDPAKNARPDVAAGACIDGGTKGWSFEGKVTNSTAGRRSYAIVVDFITVPGDTVMATRVVLVPRVGPHATADWSVGGAVPGLKNLTCVIRQSTTT